MCFFLGKILFKNPDGVNILTFCMSALLNYTTLYAPRIAKKWKKSAYIYENLDTALLLLWFKFLVLFTNYLGDDIC